MEVSQWINGISHLGIPVTNIDKAVAFYVNKLGFRLIHRKTVMDTLGTALEAAFVQLGDLLIELYKPTGSEVQTAGRSGGTIDHYAIDAPDFETCADMGFARGLMLHNSTKDGSVFYQHIGPKGVQGVNFTGPNREVIEFCHDCAKDYGRKMGLQGWSHLALKVKDLNRSLEFYEKLGFHKCADGYLDTPEGRLVIGFVQLKGFQLEIIQVCPSQRNGLDKREAGPIDHFALDVRDVRQAFYACRQSGFSMATTVVKELSLFEHGIKYFIIEGPDGERIEFNQKLVW